MYNQRHTYTYLEQRHEMHERLIDYELSTYYFILFFTSYVYLIQMIIDEYKTDLQNVTKDPLDLTAMKHADTAVI